jgi:gluconate 2-dehydrogenase gamma chain
MTHEQRTSLAAIAARLIPADEHGPGALEAGAVTYIERALEGPYAHLASRYAAGLAALDGFAALDGAAQDARLRALEGSAFFELVREHVFEGMFGDPSYGGNADRAGWALLDYSGPRREWTAEEQALDVRS